MLRTLSQKSRLQKTSCHHDYLKKGPGFSSKEKKNLSSTESISVVYLGDRVIFGKSWQEHSSHRRCSTKKLSGLITNTGTCLVFKSHSRFKERVLKNKQTNKGNQRVPHIKPVDSYGIFHIPCCLFVSQLTNIRDSLG